MRDDDMQRMFDDTHRMFTVLTACFHDLVRRALSTAGRFSFARRTWVRYARQAQALTSRCPDRKRGTPYTGAGKKSLYSTKTGCDTGSIQNEHTWLTATRDFRISIVDKTT
jgi:hypothetical protein